MSEPIRHVASERNRRKLVKLADDLADELNYLYAEHLKLRSHIEYAIGRIHRINNRLRAE
jgi:hypothetical protein